MSMPLANGTGSSVDEGVQSLLFLATLILAWVGVSRIRGTGFQRLPRAVGWIVVVLAGCAAVAAFVVPPKLRPTIAAVRPSTDARLEILSPRPGQVFRGDPADVQVHLRLIGGRIVGFTSSRLVPNEGHVHLILDGRLVSMTSSTDQTLALSPGTYRLKAEFVAVDHGPFDPPVAASVTFSVITP
ncbi:MAG TPA: hypothetical protein VGR33_03045 [Actinomycetota bacterium]|jgi:hypothetical protein|nr:hypothetical protein [Actinomycetota bacterium]